VAKYKIVDVRVDGDQVGIILEGKWKYKDKEMDDGFAVWIPLDEFKKFFDEKGNFDKKALMELLRERIKERVKFLVQTHKEWEARESRHKGMTDKVKEAFKDIEISDEES